MANHVTVDVETLRIDSKCSLEKEFTQLICIIILMVLYITNFRIHTRLVCVP